MKKIRSRRWVGTSGLFVEEVNMITGTIKCMLYRSGRPSKIWEPVTTGYSC